MSIDTYDRVAIDTCYVCLDDLPLEPVGGHGEAVARLKDVRSADGAAESSGGVR